MAVFQYEESGHLTFLRYVDSIPAGMTFPPDKGQSGILMHPSGDYLYTLFPSTSAVSTFKINWITGIPELVQYTEYDEPKLRAFALSPDSQFMFITCMQNGSVRTLAIEEDGCPTDTGRSISVPGAAYVTFVETN